MNRLTHAEFLSQTGSHGLKEVTRIAEWLLANDDDEVAPRDLDLPCRYAPSVVTRSEVDVFGLSDPRHAIRVYLEGEAGRSFLNLRRIERWRSADPGWGRRLDWLSRVCPEKISPLPTPGGRPLDFLKSASRIADSILRPPERLLSRIKDWHILEADLGREYGETLEAGKVIGTPWMRHIPLAGGGLCAQAVCFMATSLLHEYSSGVHGLLEITAMAHRRLIREAEHWGKDVYEMPLEGLDYGGMTRYFSEASLRAIKQAPRTLGNSDAGSQWIYRQDAFTAAAQAYIRSGMPIILTVDLGRMAAPEEELRQLQHGMRKIVRQPIYASNGFRHEAFCKLSTHHFARRRDHVVLMVGSNTRRGSQTFLLNDPSSLPFLEASTPQLAASGYYHNRWDQHRRLDDLSHLRSLQCLPVTPGPVRMPLMQWVPDGEVDVEDTPGKQVWKEGLFGIVASLQKGPVTLEGYQLPHVPTSERFQDFRLLKLRDLEQAVADFTSEAGFWYDTDDLLRFLSGTHAWRPDHWAWVQFVKNPRSIWIYDAESQLPVSGTWSPDARTGFLRGIVTLESRGWSTIELPDRSASLHMPAPPLQEERPTSRSQPPTLHTAASATCSLSGLDESLEAISQVTSQVELYALPSADIAHLLDANLSHRTIMDALASMDGDEANTQLAAERLREILTRHKATLSGMKSWLPEIGSPKDRQGGRAVSALRFLLKLCEELHDPEASHHTDTLQIGTGSRLQGVWPGSVTRYGETYPVFVANILSRRALGSILLRRLAEALEDLEEDSPMRISLGVQPGELQLLNGWDALVWFAEELSSGRWPEALVKRVGFSLDLPIWAFHCGIPIALADSEDPRNRAVFERIIRARISDLPGGFLVPSVTAVFHSAEDYAPWIRLLQRLANSEHPELLHLDPSVVVDLEAVGESETVQKSVQTADKLLRRVLQKRRSVALESEDSVSKVSSEAFQVEEPPSAP